MHMQLAAATPAAQLHSLYSIRSLYFLHSASQASLRVAKSIDIEQ